VRIGDDFDPNAFNEAAEALPSSQNAGLENLAPTRQRRT
jgi:hypothetical protein